MESEDMPMGKMLQKQNGKMWNWSFSTSCCHLSLLPEETLFCCFSFSICPWGCSHHTCLQSCTEILDMNVLCKVMSTMHLSRLRAWVLDHPKVNDLTC